MTALSPPPNAHHTRVLGAPPRGRPPIVAPVRRRQGPKPSTIAGALVALALLAAAIVGWRLGVGGDKKKSPVRNPAAAAATTPAASSASSSSAAPKPFAPTDVHGMQYDAAAAKLKDQGFDSVTASPVFDESVQTGVVISQTPGPGESVTPGGSAQLVVSKGPERVGVPKLVGLSKAKALKALEDARLTARPTEAYDEKAPADSVISADPPAAKPVKPGSAVAIVISKGRQPIAVPTGLKGSSYDAAAKLVSAATLKPVRSETFSSSVKTGTVISQTPASGTLFAGDPVTIVVSKGPPPVAMPLVRGLSRKEAVKRLTRLGLHVNLADFPGRRGAVVIDQRPTAGSLVPAGGTVTIYLF